MKTWENWPQNLLIIGPNVFFFCNNNQPKSSPNLNSCSKKSPPKDFNYRRRLWTAHYLRWARCWPCPWGAPRWPLPPPNCLRSLRTAPYLRWAHCWPCPWGAPRWPRAGCSQSQFLALIHKTPLDPTRCRDRCSASPPGCWSLPRFHRPPFRLQKIKKIDDHNSIIIIFGGHSTTTWTEFCHFLTSPELTVFMP